MNQPASAAYSPVHYPIMSYGRLSPPTSVVSIGQNRSKFVYSGSAGYGQPELTSNTVIGQGLGFDYGPVSSSAGYVVNGSASYPISSYPLSTAAYPVSTAGYPITVSTSGYPISSAYVSGNLSALWPLPTSQQQSISSAAATASAAFHHHQMYYGSIVASSGAPLPHQPPPQLSAPSSQYAPRQQVLQHQQPHLLPASVYSSQPLSSSAANNYPRLSYAMAGPSTTQQYQVSYTANNPRMYAAFPVAGGGGGSGVGFRQQLPRDEDELGVSAGGHSGGFNGVGKTKTPMAQLNEIAKHNRVSAQYVLVDEQGPAHKKTFFIKLRFGKEEYQASGLSIKKAQHSAAERALEATAYPRPTLRDLRELAKRRRELRALGPPPMLELTSLANRRGETVRYESFGAGGAGDADEATNAVGPAATAVSVRLTVGDRVFTADGPTVHAARQYAAVKALRQFKSESLGVANGNDQAATGDEFAEQNGSDERAQTEADGEEEQRDRPPANKSDVSLLYELANKLRWVVEFDLETENGPAHMKTFRYTCRVDQLVCQAAGKSKMAAKKTCATKMLELLRDKLGEEVYNQTVAMKSKSYYAKAFDSRKKTRNVIKEQKADPLYGNQVNPISRLIQITQARKQKDPVYSLAHDRPTPAGYSRHREYHIDCHLPSTGERTRGVGPNKKFAKRVAAEAMLELMGYRRPDPPVPRKSALKSAPASIPNSAAATADTASAASDSAAVAAASAAVAAAAATAAAASAAGKKVAIAAARGTLGGDSLPPLPEHTDLPMATLGLIARELLTEGQSLTAESINPGAACLRGRHRPKAQLLYLCEAAGCSVEFADSARQQEHGRTVYSSRVLVGVKGRLPELSAESDSVERAHDAAASLALEKLAELALNSPVEEQQQLQQQAVAEDSKPANETAALDKEC